eukprot:9478260-Pyramimonas_sp.AAC.1
MGAPAPSCSDLLVGAPLNPLAEIFVPALLEDDARSAIPEAAGAPLDCHATHDMDIHYFYLARVNSLEAQFMDLRNRRMDDRLSGLASSLKRCVDEAILNATPKLCTKLQAGMDSKLVAVAI